MLSSSWSLCFVVLEEEQPEGYQGEDGLGDGTKEKEGWSWSGIWRREGGELEEEEEQDQDPEQEEDRELDRELEQDQDREQEEDQELELELEAEGGGRGGRGGAGGAGGTEGGGAHCWLMILGLGFVRVGIVFVAGYGVHGFLFPFFGKACLESIHRVPGSRAFLVWDFRFFGFRSLDFCALERLSIVKEKKDDEGGRERERGETSGVWSTLLPQRIHA